MRAFHSPSGLKELVLLAAMSLRDAALPSPSLNVLITGTIAALRLSAVILRPTQMKGTPRLAAVRSPCCRRLCEPALATLQATTAWHCLSSSTTTTWPCSPAPWIASSVFATDVAYRKMRRGPCLPAGLPAPAADLLPAAALLEAGAAAVDALGGRPKPLKVDGVEGRIVVSTSSPAASDTRLFRPRPLDQPLRPVSTSPASLSAWSSTSQSSSPVALVTRPELRASAFTCRATSSNSLSLSSSVSSISSGPASDMSCLFDGCLAADFGAGLAVVRALLGFAAPAMRWETTCCGRGAALLLALPAVCLVPSWLLDLLEPVAPCLGGVLPGLVPCCLRCCF
mmetsp:Transcript_7346/g.18227  ORF Transcript_7346/g.18227 Transcript_7346/m.18227 type:complete len:340 (+) Transcript_7346:191-1210(+)